MPYMRFDRTVVIAVCMICIHCFVLGYAVLHMKLLGDPTACIDNDVALFENATHPPTIVIQLDFEMANYLSFIAFGYASKWMLEDDYNITVNIVLRHSYTETWQASINSIKTCFPKLRTMDFTRGNTPELQYRRKQQQDWLGHDHFFFGRNTTTNHWERTIEEFANTVKNAGNLVPKIQGNPRITLPMMYTYAFNSFPMVDRFFDRYRSLFEFDTKNPKCCGPRAQANETVFHARGFEVEVPKEKALATGYEEISPNKALSELFKHLRPGDKIAVLSLFASFGQRYVDRMREEGLDARFVNTSNGEQSFCFLMSAQKELVGGSVSTFVRWASFLGNASKVRRYSLKTPERIAKHGEKGVFQQFNFTHPALTKRFSFELYNSEVQDKIEKERQ
ncbi:hypothetical protein MHU86_4354 [Fragilaria crotonensis]|nr:hypothetical protein MHU86_4354 [Fragilaria crotonensis]